MNITFPHKIRILLTSNNNKQCKRNGNVRLKISANNDNCCCFLNFFRLLYNSVATAASVVVVVNVVLCMYTHLYISIFCFLSIPRLCSTVSPHSIFLLYTLLIFIRDHKKNKIHSFFFFLFSLSLSVPLLPKNFSVFYAVWEFCIYALSPHWFNTNSSISFDVVLNME